MLKKMAIKEFYTTLWLTQDYWVSLSVRWDDKSKYLWEDDVWEKAEDLKDKIVDKFDDDDKKEEAK